MKAEQLRTVGRKQELGHVVTESTVVTQTSRIRALVGLPVVGGLCRIVSGRLRRCALTRLRRN